MMDWTDSHCRYFHRQITRRTRLYSEMVTTGALLHGDVARLLRMAPNSGPVALQLGGSDPAELARCARLAPAWGYDEVNLNCGCPSERVQHGAFGACLMAEPQLVADCVKAMRDATALPVTVKHRTGIDRGESYDFMRDFVGTVGAAGCRVFIVHARNAWLRGLSPKQNREIPPLHYDWVYRLKRDFPELTIVLNGAVKTNAEIAAHLQHVDGVMLGRLAYHDPWVMSDWDSAFLGAPPEARTREQVEAAMLAYMEREASDNGTPWNTIARHFLGLYHGQAGARLWRQVWSDPALKHAPAAQVAATARARRTQEAPALA